MDGYQLIYKELKLFKINIIPKFPSAYIVTFQSPSYYSVLDYHKHLESFYLNASVAS